LRRIDAVSLADLYETAVMMIEPACPGYVRLVSHAVREIGNGLPRVLVEEYAGGRLEYQHELRKIRNEWPTAPELTNTTLASVGEIPVPARVVALWRALLDEDLAATNRVKRMALGLFVAAETRRSGRKLAEADVEPAVSEWSRILGWFQKQVHDNQRPIDVPQFKEQFTAFERALSGLFQEYFAARGDLDEILATTNV